MKKLAIYKLLALVAFGSITAGLHAQLIDNKINVYAGLESGTFLGGNMVTDGGFSAPSFYNNFSAHRGYFIKGLVQTGSLISVGIYVGGNQALEWEHANSADYQDAECKQVSIGPVFQIHTRQLKTGFFNRSKLFLQLIPLIGLSDVNLVSSIFMITYDGQIMEPLLISTDPSYGFEGSAGIEWYVNQSFGLTVNYSMKYSNVSSLLYSDLGYISSAIQAGVILKLAKNKNYIY